LQGGREIRPNPKYVMGKWKFIVSKGKLLKQEVAREDSG
jgi:hypothetical protein